MKYFYLPKIDKCKINNLGFFVINKYAIICKILGGNFMQKGIITVVGKDQVGIIAKVCSYLATKQVNILDISQTIIQGYFNMMMIVELSHISEEFAVICEELDKLGVEIGVNIKLQHEDIFNKMHRI